MFDVSENTPAIVFNAVFTDGSVHLMLCVDNWSYLLAPAWRR